MALFIPPALCRVVSMAVSPTAAAGSKTSMRFTCPLSGSKVRSSFSSSFAQDPWSERGVSVVEAVKKEFAVAGTGVPIDGVLPPGPAPAPLLLMGGVSPLVANFKVACFSSLGLVPISLVPPFFDVLCSFALSAALSTGFIPTISPAALVIVLSKFGMSLKIGLVRQEDELFLCTVMCPECKKVQDGNNAVARHMRIDHKLLLKFLQERSSELNQVENAPEAKGKAAEIL
jgi:hypothetical protein